MDGWPVWLASVSRRSIVTDRLVPTGKWTPGQYREGMAILEKALHRAGDASRQRIFRMNITLCLHRALTVEEVGALPGSCPVRPVNLAGGPIEVLWETVPGSDSTKPCHNPTREPLPGEPPITDLWLPIDCQTCPPCLARKRIEEEVMTG
jgi:hypothetical protein